MKRLFRSFRLWWWTRQQPECTGGEPWRHCGYPAIATVMVMATRRPVCGWHLQPLEDPKASYASLTFLSRLLDVAPIRYGGGWE